MSPSVKSPANDEPPPHELTLSGVREASSIRTDAFRVGDVIDGKYVVERVLGVGGVGIVLAARHTELDELVAIKFLLPAALVHPEIVRRFSQEARAAVRIKSEHAARVFDVGTMPGRGPYFVMEYLEGKDFADVLAESGALPIRRAVEAVLQVCEALAVAHSCSIVHRDIKPENLFLARRADGTEIVKVLDFGISKIALVGPPTSGERASKEAPMGSPLYMSPEQIGSHSDIDHRTDIWSLGVVLYELLTGRAPFQGDGESLAKICREVVEGKAPPLSASLVEVPEGLQGVIDRCLEKEPSRRFQNVAELAIALLPFGPSKGRLFAERASTILRAAGQTGVTLKYQSSAPPPSGGLPGYTSVRVPSQPPVPTFGSQPVASASPEALVAIANDARNTRRIVSVAGVLLLLLAGVVAFVVLRAPRAQVVAAPIAAGLHQVTVESEPAGVRVESGGKLLGETPLTLQLPEGSQTLDLTKEGFAPESLTVTVAPADTDKHAKVTMRRGEDSLATAPRVPRAAPVAAPVAVPSPQAAYYGRAQPPRGATRSGAPSALPPASVAPQTAAAPPPPAKPSSSPTSAATTAKVRAVDESNRVHLIEEPAAKVPQL